MAEVFYANLQRCIAWFLAGAVLSFASALIPLHLYHWTVAWEAFLRINAKLTIPLFPGIFALIAVFAVLHPIATVLRSDRSLKDQQITVGLFLAGLATGLLAAFVFLFFNLEST